MTVTGSLQSSSFLPLRGAFGLVGDSDRLFVTINSFESPVAFCIGRSRQEAIHKLAITICQAFTLKSNTLPFIASWTEFIRSAYCECLFRRRVDYSRSRGRTENSTANRCHAEDSSKSRVKMSDSSFWSRSLSNAVSFKFTMRFL